MKRLARFAPEEIAGAVLLAVVVALALVRPAAIGQLFESPYATPAPGGGVASEVVGSPTPTVNLSPRPTPATAEEAANWIRWGNGPQAPLASWRSIQIDAQCGDVGRVVVLPAAPTRPLTVLCVRVPPTPSPAQ